MSLKRKAMAGFTAAALIALIATGTFAWTNLNSQRLNEWRGAGSPENEVGGVLHDDHRDNEPNKAVYIENWGAGDLFVRIRLSEYMEMGTGAGLKSTTTDPSTGEIVHNPLNLAKSLISGADIDHVETWRIYDPYRVYPTVIDENSIDNYWLWNMGGQKYYYPAPESSRANKGYVDQNSPAGLTKDSVNSDGVQAKQTAFAQVLTMTQWKAEGSPIGDYWVIDADGWAYWAAPLKPGQATGLLLNSVTQTKPPAKDYYYGINVAAQMATKDGAIDSNGLKDNYERFGDEDQGGWSADGQRLMELITGKTNQEVKAIDEIHIHFGSFGRTVQEYKIDFIEKKLWEFQNPLDFESDYGFRDPLSENEGYTFVCDLSDEKIADFWKACMQLGLAEWEESYIEPLIMDGIQWSVTVEYSDSTVMKSYGSNKFPETWDKFYDAFLVLSGLGDM